jgi:hypothetical protein
MGFVYKGNYQFLFVGATSTAPDTQHTFHILGRNPSHSDISSDNEDVFILPTLHVGIGLLAVAHGHLAIVVPDRGVRYGHDVLPFCPATF